MFGCTVNALKNSEHGLAKGKQGRAKKIADLSLAMSWSVREVFVAAAAGQF